MKENLKEAYLLALQHLKREQSALIDLEQRIGILKQLIFKYQGICNELKYVICLNCNGYGKVNHVYDQDDIKQENCINCGGTGLSKDAI